MEADRPLDPFVKEDPEPGDFTDQRLGRLLEHWRSLCAAAQRLPAASEIDPEPLKFILGWLMIIDPLDGGTDFQYRLYGSRIADVTGRDLTGCKVSDSFPEFVAFTNEVYRTALRTQHPMLTRHTPPKLIIVERWERLILPFAGPDGRGTRFLVGAAPLGMRDEAKRRLPWPLRGGVEN
jgi:hypothetical protein